MYTKLWILISLANMGFAFHKQDPGYFLYALGVLLFFIHLDSRLP